VDHFGKERVFMDVDALEPGVRFADRIQEEIGSAEAVLVVIGRGWLTAEDLDGSRRLDDPKDFIRLEVGTALRGDPIVIPVLVGGATMPREEELPDDLALLAGRNALTMIDADWHSGLGRLVAGLKRILEPVAEPAALVERQAVLPRVEDEAAEVHEDQSGVSELRIPVLASALGFAGMVALVAGTWLQVDLWAHPSPRNPGADRDGLGYFSSFAPAGIVVGAGLSFLFSYSRGAARLGTGLFLGFALAGVARYVGWLGTAGVTEREETTRAVSGAWLALAGCLLLAGAAAARIVADREQRGAGPGALPRALVLAGAVLVVAGTIVPFNVGPAAEEQSLIERSDGWAAFEPIAAAVFAAAASFFLARSRTVASGAVIGLGIFLCLLWAGRYIGFPAWQPNTVSEVGAGGFIGLGGGLAILAGGLVARPKAVTASIPTGARAEGAR
jgi:uncharacterized membrane protein YidH (DUF202 family)